MISVHVMGSGSANILQRRNKSAVIVNMYSDDQKTTALIDCGAKNLLSLPKLIFSQIRWIFITHTHSDHIQYLGWVLRKINRHITNGSKVKLFYPPEREFFLKLLIRAYFLGRIPRFIELLNENEKKLLSFYSNEIKQIDAINNIQVWACKAAHRAPAHVMPLETTI